MPKPTKCFVINIFLEDTPRVDDTFRNDCTVLKAVNNCLCDTFTGGWDIAGVLYLQNINENRVETFMMKCLHIFGNIVGF